MIVKNSLHKEICSFWDDEEFQSAWKSYLSVRKKHKCADDSRSQIRTLKKLIKLCEKNKDLAIDILDQSSDMGWRGLFPIKDCFNSGYNKAPNKNTRRDSVELL